MSKSTSRQQIFDGVFTESIRKNSHPDAVAGAISNKRRTLGEKATPEECLKDLGFNPREIKTLLLLIAPKPEATKRLVEAMGRLFRTHPQKIFEYCVDLELAQYELADAIGMTHTEIDVEMRGAHGIFS